MNQVLQDWVQNLTLMQQSVLISSVRAPDTLRKSHPAKILMRWYRRCIMICAFDKCIHNTPYEHCGGKYTGPIIGISIDKLAEEYLVNVDEIPHHFHLHLTHAAQILGYKHPNETIRNWWHLFYIKSINDMHLNAEDEYDMDIRLSDNEENWKKRENYPMRMDA